MIKNKNEEFLSESQIKVQIEINALERDTPQAIYALTPELTELEQIMSGNLFAQYKIENPDINPEGPGILEISYYCTDVQIDNPKAQKLAR